jgi:hypothetical protein
MSLIIILDVITDINVFIVSTLLIDKFFIIMVE